MKLQHNNIHGIKQTQVLEGKFTALNGFIKKAWNQQSKFKHKKLETEAQINPKQAERRK